MVELTGENPFVLVVFFFLLSEVLSCKEFLDLLQSTFIALSGSATVLMQNLVSFSYIGICMHVKFLEHMEKLFKSLEFVPIWY